MNTPLWPDTQSRQADLASISNLADEFPDAVLKQLVDLMLDIGQCCDFDAAVRGYLVKLLFPDCPYIDFKRAMSKLDLNWEWADGP